MKELREEPTEPIDKSNYCCRQTGNTGIPTPYPILIPIPIPTPVPITIPMPIPIPIRICSPIPVLVLIPIPIPIPIPSHVKTILGIARGLAEENENNAWIFNNPCHIGACSTRKAESRSASVGVCPSYPRHCHS